MTTNNGFEEKSGRELRLLLLVIAVAVGVLLVLSRFRYPSTDLAAVTPVVTPIERTPARAPFEELSSTISDLAPRLSAYVIAIQADRAPQKGDRKSASASVLPVERRSFAALRVRPDLALAYVPAGMRVEAVSGERAPAQVVASDARRELVLMRVAASSDLPDLGAAGSDFSGLTYVIAVEGALAGPALRPVFIPRADTANDARWMSGALRIGGEASISAGTVLFTLQGRLLGLTVPLDGGLAVVSGAALDRTVVDLLTAGTGGQ